MRATGLKSAFTWILACVLAGCTTMQPLHGIWRDNAPDAKAIRQQLRTGDVVRVTTRDRDRQKLKITALDEAALAGTLLKPAGAGKPTVAIPYEQIWKIELQEAGSETAGKVVGTVVAVTGVVLMFGLLNSLCTSEICEPSF